MKFSSTAFVVHCIAFASIGGVQAASESGDRNLAGGGRECDLTGMYAIIEAATYYETEGGLSSTGVGHIAFNCFGWDEQIPSTVFPDGYIGRRRLHPHTDEFGSICGFEAIGFPALGSDDGEGIMNIGPAMTGAFGDVQDLPPQDFPPPFVDFVTAVAQDLKRRSCLFYGDGNILPIWGYEGKRGVLYIWNEFAQQAYVAHKISKY